jgi:hypothetical protein
MPSNANLSIDALLNKVYTGRRWLTENDKESAAGYWQANLEYYESIVDELHLRGYEEPDMLSNEKLNEASVLLQNKLASMTPSGEAYERLYHEWFAMQDEQKARGVETKKETEGR